MFVARELKKYLKIEFSFKYCEFLHYLEDNYQTILYFSMLYPPRYYVASYTDDYFIHPEYNDLWERIPNFGLYKN